MRVIDPELYLGELEACPDPNDFYQRCRAFGSACQKLMPYYERGISGLEEAIEKGRGNCFARTFALSEMSMADMRAFGCFTISGRVDSTRLHANALFVTPDLGRVGMMRFWGEELPEGNLQYPRVDEGFESQTWAQLLSEGSRDAPAAVGVSVLRTGSQKACAITNDETADKAADYVSYAMTRGGICEIIVSMELINRIAPELITGDLGIINRLAQKPTGVLRAIIRGAADGS